MPIISMKTFGADPAPDGRRNIGLTPIGQRRPRTAPQSAGQTMPLGNASGTASTGTGSATGRPSSSPRHQAVTPLTRDGCTASPSRGITSGAWVRDANPSKVSAGSSQACMARLKVPQCTGRKAPPLIKAWA